MTVRQIETEMPASELAEWLAHIRLSNAEAERAAERQKRMSRGKSR